MTMDRHIAPVYLNTFIRAFRVYMLNRYPNGFTAQQFREALQCLFCCQVPECMRAFVWQKLQNNISEFPRTPLNCADTACAGDLCAQVNADIVVITQ